MLKLLIKKTLRDPKILSPFRKKSIETPEFLADFLKKDTREPLYS